MEGWIVKFPNSTQINNIFIKENEDGKLHDIISQKMIFLGMTKKQQYVVGGK